MKCSTTIGAAVLVLLMALPVFADTHVPGGNVSGVWTLAGAPYILDGNVVIHQDSTLLIDPGVEVLMAPFRRFRCEGQLLAIGTETDSIWFTATDTLQGSEGVDFLNTDSSPRDSSKMEYSNILYGVGSSAPDLYMHGGGLYIEYSSRLLISHCTMAQCRTRNVSGPNGIAGQPSWQGGPGTQGGDALVGHGGAIFCGESSPIISFCLLAYNHTGDALGGRGGDGGAGSNYELSAYGGGGGAGGNGEAGHGGALYLTNSAAVIEGNIIIGNFTGSGMGGQGGHGGNAYTVYYLMEPPFPYAVGGPGGFGGAGYAGKGGAIWAANSSAALLTNNLIAQNRTGTGQGGTGGQGGTASGAGLLVISHGLGGMGGNGFGGDGYAMYISNGSPAITNSTIAQHTQLSAGLGGPGGLNGNGTITAPAGTGSNGTNLIFGSASISNCITWGNVDPNLSGSSIVNYSCIQGGFPGIGNISSDPLFVNPALDNYCLSQIASGQTQQSPAVDAGNPGSPMIIGSTRTDGVQDSGVVDMGYHYPLAMPQSQITLTLTPHNPPIQIPAGGGSFQFDVNINYSQPLIVDFWTIITLPDSTPLPILLRQNVALPPGGSVVRPNLTQFVPGSALPGTYIYSACLRDHATWESLAADSFSFVKLAGEDSPSHDLGWALLGWEDGFSEPETSSQFILLNASPNPFNPTTTIRYELPYMSHVQLAVYDIRGRLVADLVNGVRSAGVQELTFDATNLPSGMYFYRLQANGQSEVKKMMLVK